ncbi:uncharacterized protein LOC128230646 [Mya arenaria]|uniref:uncharacterized protein LOC128230646 n=1 Tax=Mya arenaria TaxID=6604 RepID=UPI0022DF6C2A|nr:uncharacterized protein LOC128230646 [Mya arenaria]
MAIFRNIILAVYFAHSFVQGVPADCCDALKIITRAEWGARDPKTTLNIAVPVSTFFIHHTDTYGCETQDVCSARVRSIQRYHMEVKNWTDIGYSFLIGGDGNVYEGRGWNFVGAHTYGYNSVSFAASFIGNYTSMLPNAKANKAVDNLIECGVHRGKIKPSYTLQGHRDAKQSKTKCPGDALYREIQTWNNYPDSGKTVERDIRESPQGPPDQEGHLELCDASGKFCGWNQDGPLFWSKRHGEADWAGKTGPSSDSTGSLTGDYLLADATDSTAYKSVKIYSDHYPYDSSANSLYCVDFQYHMFGQDVGTLSLKLVLDDRYRKTVWHLSGDHGNRWIRKRVAVNTATSIIERKMHFEFIATFRGSYLGDIALDNIRIGKGRCEMVGMVTRNVPDCFPYRWNQISSSPNFKLSVPTSSPYM